MGLIVKVVFYVSFGNFTLKQVRVEVIYSCQMKVVIRFYNNFRVPKNM